MSCEPLSNTGGAGTHGAARRPTRWTRAKDHATTPVPTQERHPVCAACVPAPASRGFANEIPTNSCFFMCAGDDTYTVIRAEQQKLSKSVQRDGVRDKCATYAEIPQRSTNPPGWSSQAPWFCAFVTRLCWIRHGCGLHALELFVHHHASYGSSSWSRCRCALKYRHDLWRRH